ncbi:hypothetical protein CAPTEDRAFT_185144 [Capitella teleta]|uniref:Uncharacterized protein n=1 Tax=Capitella teleta TaxID=283909 RepID=R7TGZ1_CAPTE|nr:hypothetical protein CAPTEDRAFT_185144 [Capitella teleta]|eukprot:ELT93083.1 hypothetical protein CAPTEDRAFT_185144 [Capitella teleta]
MATKYNPAPEFDLTMDTAFIERRMNFISDHRELVKDEINALSLAIMELECEFHSTIDEDAAHVTDACLNDIAEKIRILELEREEMAEYADQLRQEYFLLDDMLETMSMDEDTLSAIASEDEPKLLVDGYSIHATCSTLRFR